MDVVSQKVEHLRFKRTQFARRRHAARREHDS